MRGLSATNFLYDYLPTFTSRKVYWVLEISAEIYRMTVINLRLCSDDWRFEVGQKPSKKVDSY